jgi:hypothetical protein
MADPLMFLFEFYRGHSLTDSFCAAIIGQHNIVDIFRPCNGGQGGNG